MADRPPPVTRPTASRPPRIGASSSSSTTSSAAGGVRRNLFQSQLTRRPTPTNSASTSAETLRLDGSNTVTTTTNHGGAAAASSTTGAATVVDVLSDDAAATDFDDGDAESASLDIVIRDQNGDFEVGNPPTPPMDDGEAGPGSDGGGLLDEGMENERERHKLAEAVKHHHINYHRGPSQPEEFMEVLRASMRAQVAALSEDSWMYAPEEQPRGH